VTEKEVDLSTEFHSSVWEVFVFGAPGAHWMSLAPRPFVGDNAAVGTGLPGDRKNKVSRVLVIDSVRTRWRKSTIIPRTGVACPKTPEGMSVGKASGNATKSDRPKIGLMPRHSTHQISVSRHRPDPKICSIPSIWAYQTDVERKNTPLSH
jgi:hypothetical protein